MGTVFLFVVLTQRYCCRNRRQEKEEAGTMTRDHCHDDSHDSSVIMTLLIKLCRQKERQTNCQTKLGLLMIMS